MNKGLPVKYTVFESKWYLKPLQTSMPKAQTWIYGVKTGRVPGVYLTWPECEAQVKGQFSGLQHPCKLFELEIRLSRSFSKEVSYH